MTGDGGFVAAVELRLAVSRATTVVEAARRHRAARSGGTRPQQFAAEKSLYAALDAFDAARAMPKAAE